MITTTSNPPTPDVLAHEEATPRPAPRKPSWAAKLLVIALIACVTGGILLLAGVFDSSSSSDINIDPVSNKPATATSTAPRPADAKVVVEYVAAMKTWNECMAKHAADATTDKCGAMPEQVDSPALNAYLAEVLNWNKCAAPLLKKGATAQAEEACGPSPAPPASN